MVSTKKKLLASGDKAALLHADRPKKEKGKNHISRSISRKFGASLENARLTRLENTLIAQINHAETPFAQIVSVSNPLPVSNAMFPALQLWFETYRTTDREAVNQILRLTQEVVFGTNIITSRTNESEARRECYGLAEELEDRIVGFMPTLTSDIEVIFPIFDLDASFVQMEQSGLFTLSIMWSLTWQIAKGAKV